MNYTQKFNRALLKAISLKKIEKQDFNSGATRKVNIRFSFFHEGITNYLYLETSRDVPGLDFLGFKNKFSMKLLSCNSSYTTGFEEEILVDIDYSILRYIYAYSIFSIDEVIAVHNRYLPELKEYQPLIS
jgi:hypothetical protein